MKKMLLLFILLGSTAAAQDSLMVTEAGEEYFTGSYPSFIIDIPNDNIKSVRSEWKTYLKFNVRRNPGEKNGDIFLGEGIIPGLGKDTVSLISHLEENAGKIRLSAAFLKSDSTAISTSTDEEISNSAKIFLRKFAIQSYRSAVETEIRSEMKKQSSLEEAVLKLENENESRRRKISDNERLIERKRGDILGNEQEQTLMSSAILQHKTMMMDFRGTEEQKKQNEKKLKELNQSKEKLQDEKEEMMKKIDDKESENRFFQKQIDKNLDENIPLANAAVVAQKEIVNALNMKLIAIK